MKKIKGWIEIIKVSNEEHPSSAYSSKDMIQQVTAIMMVTFTLHPPLQDVLHSLLPKPSSFSSTIRTCQLCPTPRLHFCLQ